MFHGSIPALITPFASDQIDDAAFTALVNWQIENGSTALVPCGTTGESPTLSHDEKLHVIKLCVAAAAKRVPVIAGTGSNCTKTAIELTAAAQAAGAEAALIAMPYYNKPTQEGLFQHFKTLHDAVELPLIIYNIPGRSVVNMTPETMGRLAALPRIVGVKDSTGDLERPVKDRAACGDTFCLLSGEDGTALAYLAMGGQGCISVLANIAPRQSAELQAAWARRDFDTAARLRDQLAELNQLLFVETNPGPVKYAASLLGFGMPSLRLPLVEPSAENKQKIRDAMQRAGLLQKRAA